MREQVGNSMKRLGDDDGRDIASEILGAGRRGNVASSRYRLQ